MKKLVIIITLLMSSFGFAQQEVKFDIFDAIALKTIDISYERYISRDTSLGLSALFNLDNKASFSYNEKTMFTPYLRHHFNREQKFNFFGELFMGINSGTRRDVSYTDGALGIAVGSKYVSSGGFIIDIHAGLGRNLFSDKSPSIVPRVGINLGFRI